MSLNIKNERTHAMVKELARRTGRSQTSAVEEAVARRLEEMGVDIDAPLRAKKLDAARSIVAEFQADLSDQDIARMRSHETELYDALGAPR